MLNNVILIGRLTKDPEMRYTPSGQAVTTFTLAVDRGYQNQQGQKEVDFISIVTWAKTAENVANFVKKGRLVAIEGRIQTRNYENNEGKKVYVTEVVADQVKFLESAKDNRSETVPLPPEPTNFGNKTNSINQSGQQSSNSSSFGTSLLNDSTKTNLNESDFTDDDLPFNK
jgi:single-strand DNA-binding protein